MRLIITQLPSLKGMYKSNSSSVFLGYPSLTVFGRELQSHPTLYGTVDKSKNLAVNLITNNGKISYADVCKELKNKYVKRVQGKDILMKNIKE